MLIYTGNPDGEKIARCKSLGLGVMIATSAQVRINQNWKSMPCALDNGAFRCWQRGFPFQKSAFMNQLEACYRNGLSLDWIVCPDIVAAGRRSLEFSLRWARGVLFTAPRLALAVQDGITPKDVLNTGAMVNYPHISHIFVGGTESWKWANVEEWISFAHKYGRKCHIGRCGTIKHLRAAARWNADSVDSTSFSRNGSWHIVEEYLDAHQLELDSLKEDRTP